MSEYSYETGAILIGFNYQNTNGRDNYLPGIIIDLYLMYKYCVNKLRIPRNKIKIITDITQRHDPVYGATVAGIVDSDVLYFIDDKDIIIYKDVLDIENNIRELTANCNLSNFLVYYTGHGKDGFINLPTKNGESEGMTLSLTTFKNMLFSILSIETSILWLVDCCHANGAEMPYRYNKGKNYIELNNVDTHTEHICILIVSCENNEKTTTTLLGSEFTNKFINVINSNKTRSLFTFFNCLSIKSECYLTFPSMYILPSWIYGTSTSLLCLYNGRYLELLK